MRSGKNRRAHTTGIAAVRRRSLAPPTERAALRCKRAEQSVNQSCINLRHVAETERLRRRRLPAQPRYQPANRRASAFGIIRVVHRNDTLRPLSAASTFSALMAGNDDHRSAPARPSACSAAMRTSGLPPICGDQLVDGRPCGSERPAASTTAATRLPASSDRLLRGAAGA